MSIIQEDAMIIKELRVEKFGLQNAPAAKQTALTVQSTSLTHTAAGSSDFAIQDLVQPAGYGFVTKDEGNTVLEVILNLQTRVAEIEAKLQTLGLIA